MFFHNYYVKQEQIKDQIKEVEKDRIIRQIKKSKQESRRRESQQSEKRVTSLLQNLRWPLKDSRLISPN